MPAELSFFEVFFHQIGIAKNLKPDTVQIIENRS